MKQKKYRVIFVALVYRNIQDVVEFIEDKKKLGFSYKIVIVNSFYDKESDQEFRKIAKDNAADYISVENRGYGYGNNVGIKYALSNYTFDYIVVANPDTQIEAFSLDKLSRYGASLIGPVIHTLSGKNQNPYWAVHNPLAEKWIYRGHVYNKRSLLVAGIIFNKAIRLAWLFLAGLTAYRWSRVFALHGSFVIYPYALFAKLGDAPYDEAIFLFAEEADMAHTLKKLGVQSHVTSCVRVLHKEDGSMNVAKIDGNHERRKSVSYYYRKHGLR